MKFGKGTIYNHSSKTLWVVADGVAHLLGPKRRSPPGIDADGAKAADGTAIGDHRSWWKVPDFFALHIRDDGHGKLQKDFLDFAWAVDEGEFGPLKYDHSDGWGQSISD